MEALAGKRIIVTGAARGIGAAVMRVYAQAGARVAGLDVRREEGVRMVAELGGPDTAFFYACDVSRRMEVEAVFEAAAKSLGGLDVLAAIAGVDRPAPAEAVEQDDWDLVMDANARGTYLTNQAAFAYMKESGGAIINFGSMAGIRGMADRAAYSAAKGAVAAWSRSAALAWGKHGIRVNVVAPVMHTEVAQRYLDRLPPEERQAIIQRLAAQVPLGGQLGEPERDLGPLMVFLAGEGARFITGQTFAVDGGMTMLGS